MASNAGAPKAAPPKELTVAEMEALLLERITVDDAQLAELARRRGDGARGWLVAEGRLPADRVSVSAPAADANAAQASRVSFALR